MLALGIVLNVVGLGFLCWLLFMLAVYALPTFAAVTAGMYLYDLGTGPILSIIVALLCGCSVHLLGRLVFHHVASPLVRAAIALLFAAPAAIAGYHAIYGLSALILSPGIWQQTFAISAAILTGGAAWSRLAAVPSFGGQGWVGTAP